MRRWPKPALMLITDRARLRGSSMEEVASLAVEGGVNVVQLREKDLSGGELYELAITLREALRGRALLLVNERVDVAVGAKADGVHLPERGLPADAVWSLVGSGCIVGRSVHSVEAAVEAVESGADFVQAGTVFETASKPGQAPAGVDLVRDVAAAVPVPVIAVGGVTADNVAEVVKAGAAGVAVIGAIWNGDDPQAAAVELYRALDEAYRG